MDTWRARCEEMHTNIFWLINDNINQMQSGKSINIRQHNQPAGITPQRKKHIFVTNQNVTEIFEQDELFYAHF